MERGEKFKFDYIFVQTIRRQHSNLPYSERQNVKPHEHDFRIEIQVKAKEMQDFGQNNYEIDVITFERLFQDFLNELPHNLNEHEVLGGTSCSIEDILEYIAVYFKRFLRENNFAKIRIKKISVWESETRGVSAKLKNFRKELKLTK